MFSKLRAYFIQGALDKTDDIFEQAQIEATYNLNFAFAILYTGMLIHFTTLDTSIAFDIVNIVSWIWTVLIIFTIRWTKSHFWPGFSFVIMGMCVSTSMDFLSHDHIGVESGVWHAFGIVNAFLLLGRKWGYIIGSFYVISTTFQVIDHINDWKFYDIGLNMGRSVEDPVAVAIPLTASVYMLGYFMLTRRNAQNIIAKQKESEEEQRLLLEEKNFEITSSITYAKRIQEAILPARKKWTAALPNSFVLYKPKDIVAGDFYWLEKSNGKIIFAAADCTGHGVPGAMVSVVCHNALNRAVREFGLDKPAEILDKTQELVIETFEQADGQVKDGMDISMIALDKARNKIFFAGAHNSLFHVRNGEMIEIKSDKQPVGEFENRKPFTHHELEIQTGDVLYLFTDGFPDQFGGPKGKKFKYKNLKDLLLKNHQQSMDEQRIILDSVFENWRGSLEQVDDICVIGVRV